MATIQAGMELTERLLVKGEGALLCLGINGVCKDLMIARAVHCFFRWYKSADY